MITTIFNRFTKKEKITSQVIQKDIQENFDKIYQDFAQKEKRSDKIKKTESMLYEYEKKNKDLIDKIKTLNQLGMTRTPSTVKMLKEYKEQWSLINKKVNDLKSEDRQVKQLEDLYKKYELEFPSYRFIDDKTMFLIMEKYDLFIGDACLYTKEIPTENLIVISKFNEYIQKSKKFLYLYIHNYYGYHFRGVDITNDTNYKHIETFIVSDLKIIAPLNHFVVKKLKKDFNSTLEKEQFDLITVNKNRELVIELNKVNEIYAKNIELLDPIACLKVKGGYIIMTAWDKEAEIPEIFNPNLN